MKITSSTPSRPRFPGVEFLLRSVDSMLLHERSVPEILQHVCDQLTREFDYELAWVGLNQADGTLKVAAFSIPTPHLLTQMVLRWDTPADQSAAFQLAVQTGRIQLARAGDPTLARCQALFPTVPVGAAVAIPLRYGEGVLGVLCLYARSERALAGGVLSEVVEIGDRLAVSLRMAHERETLRLQSAALQETAQAVIITDPAGRILWVNPAFTNLTGYPAAEAVGQTPALLKSGLTPDHAYAEFWRSLDCGEVWRGEFANRRKDGSLYYSEQTVTPVRDESGRITHFVALQQDVTERHMQAERIRYLAEHDDLTGLPNRRAFSAKLQDAAASASLSRPGALLLIDLDNFKLVNESLGHAAGDQTLIDLAGRLLRCIHTRDFLARLGGDEFAIILQKRDRESALLTAQQVREEILAEGCGQAGNTFDLSASIGLVMMEGDRQPEELLATADSALYAAKDLGKNRVVVAHGTEDQARGTTAASMWAKRIRDALRHERIALHLQPIVNLSTGRVDHHEVLIRMIGPEGRLILPAQFIAAAERFGLMTGIDRYVVAHAIGLLKSHPDAELFVNLSAVSLRDDSLRALLEQGLKDEPDVARRLILEITETAAIWDLEQAQHWMEGLRQLGCRFALDDFGSGFASFTYLRRLPFDYIKIDGSFVRGLETEASNRTVVQALTAVAHALGKAVVAEWVESAQTVELLRGMGVEYGQGFYLGEPEPQVM